jgi:DNA-binding GntR family transcriptional regulator
MLDAHRALAPSIQLRTDADLRLTQTEHEAIFDALKCGDAEAAASAVRAHLTCDHLPPPKPAAADRPAG